ASVPQHVLKQQAGGYSVQVGDTIVTAFTDGSVPQDLHALLRRTTAENTDALLAKNFQANPVEASINAFYIAIPGHKILVDTGSGQLFGPGKGGRLIESLATQGIKPQDITDILITHAHSDHAGGLVKDGQRVFTRAQVYVGKPDIDFFFNDENQKKSGYDQNYFDVARKTLKP
ncbi:MBL fold metallo-hydrolase, partial [Enterobacter hormaechei]|nr:MBL fold metallo-hydrolase [Enterobacter hormaechei]